MTTLTKQKQLTIKEAQTKYGIIYSTMQRLDKVKFYLLPNGNVIDSAGDIRYINKLNETTTHCKDCDQTYNPLYQSYLCDIPF